MVEGGHRLREMGMEIKILFHILIFAVPRIFPDIAHFPMLLINVY